jgi:hypothetical protein
MGWPEISGILGLRDTTRMDNSWGFFCLSIVGVKHYLFYLF